MNREKKAMVAMGTWVWEWESTNASIWVDVFICSPGEIFIGVMGCLSIPDSTQLSRKYLKYHGQVVVSSHEFLLKTRFSQPPDGPHSMWFHSLLNLIKYYFDKEVIGCPNIQKDGLSLCSFVMLEFWPNPIGLMLTTWVIFGPLDRY